eukprot:403366379
MSHEKIRSYPTITDYAQINLQSSDKSRNSSNSYSGTPSPNQTARKLNFNKINKSYNKNQTPQSYKHIPGRYSIITMSPISPNESSLGLYMKNCNQSQYMKSTQNYMEQTAIHNINLTQDQHQQKSEKSNVYKRAYINQKENSMPQIQNMSSYLPTSQTFDD